VRLVLLDHPHVGQAAVHTVAQGKINQSVHAAERDHGLGPLFGQHFEPAAPAAGQDERKDFGTFGWHSDKVVPAA
jgi:hypothetical protein